MRHTNWERIVSILLLAPSAIAIAIFVYGFIGFTSFASLTRWRQPG
jgi:glucose/mannose transport system permease protein